MSLQLVLQVPEWAAESTPPTLREARRYRLPYGPSKRGGEDTPIDDILAKADTGPVDLESLDLGPGLGLGPELPSHTDPVDEPNPSSKKPKRPPTKTPAKKLTAYGTPTVWPYDRVSELKEKIYLHTGIPPFRQHLRLGDTPLSYEVMAEVAVQLPTHWDLPTVQDLPIREDLATNRESIRIYALDHFTAIGEILPHNTKDTQLTVWDLADFVRHPEALRADHHQLALVYYGFLILYWPMLSWEALLGWLRSPDHLGTSYPELSPPPATLLKRYEAEAAVLGRLPGTLAPLSDPTIRQAVATLRGNRAMLNISRLLAHTHTGAAAPLVRARLYYEHRSALITKVHEQQGEAAFEHLRYRLQMPEMPSLIIAVNLRTPKTGIEHDYAALVLRSHGPIQVRTQWNESDRMTFTQLTRLLAQTNPYLQHINALGREVLTSSHPLPTLTAENIRYTSVTVQLFWPRALAPEAWTRLMAHLQGDFPAGVAAPHPEEGVPQGMYMFRFLKGTETRAVDPPRTETELDSYEYLTNAKTRVRWIAAYGNGRTVVLLNRATDLRVEIQDTREAELPLLREYLTGHLHRAEAGHGTKSAPVHRGKNWKVSPKNILRLLKSMDPNLFNFRQHGSDVVYSRVCQKSHQPIALTQAQYKAAVADPTTRRRYQFVPYRNFTNPDQPLVYTCLHPNNPHFSLIAGQHPKGYCLPCCKKTAMDLNERTKRSHQYRMCLERGEYAGEAGQTDTGSRYILNYGKALEINRIGHLPDLFLRYLLYNSQLLVGADLRNIGQSAYYLYGVPQTAAHVDSLGVLYCLSNALGVAPEEYLGGLARALRGHPEWHANMVQGQLGDYYPLREFLHDLTTLIETGQHHALRFQLWNEVLIELTKYVHGLDVVILEDLSTDTSGTSHRATAEGVDLVLPRHITRAEELFPGVGSSAPGSSASAPGTRTRKDREKKRGKHHKRGGVWEGNPEDDSPEEDDMQEYTAMWRAAEALQALGSQRRYLVVLRRQRRSRGLFGSHYIYFPVYRVTPQAFFRDNAIEQRIYTERDDLIHLLGQLAVQALEGTRPRHDWTLPDLLAQATQLGYPPHELLLNHRGQVHTLVLDAAKDHIYVPIPYQYPTEGLAVRTALPDRARAVELARLLAFLDAWNAVRETWRLQRTLCDRRDRVLGVKAGGLYFYCRPAAGDVSRLLRGTSLWPLAESRQYLWHMPEEINRAVERPEGDLPDPHHLRARAEEGMRSYRREVRQIMSQFDRDRNPAMRKRIEALGRRGRRSMVSDLQELGVSPADIERLQTNGFRLGSDLYEFDQTRLAHIRGLGEDREVIRAYLGRQFQRVSAVTLDLLAAELANPLQREYLLRAILLEDLSLDEVRHWPDEEVYILR